MDSERRTALIQGASRGIGLEMTRLLLADGWRVAATCRRPETASGLQALAATVGDTRCRLFSLDVSREDTMEKAASDLAGWTQRLSLLVNSAGILHDEGVGPERRLSEVRPDALHKVFAVNAFGPLLVAKHFERFFLHKERAVFANVSARVGSIGDNRAGGWYAYRASKAAQNMFTKGLSIELGRRAKGLIVLAVHPGTVATDLSAPFVPRRGPDKRFTVERGASQLLEIFREATLEDSGKFFAWDGSEIVW
jgi:NAD(P)-dependent dehydrogenase (short-subunit alcohol dehydrogenase family)